MQLKFYTVDVFSDQVFGGNPLVVFPDASQLSAEQMQRIAAEFNLSEAAFVKPPSSPGSLFSLRIFTPKMELPFAGHPTVGTAFVMASTRRIALDNPVTTLVIDEAVGPIQVTIDAQDGVVSLIELSSAMMPEYGPPPPAPEQLARLLSVETTQIERDWLSPLAVSCGVPFMIIPVVSHSILRRVELNVQVWQELLSSFWAPHVYPIYVDKAEKAKVYSRMFSPAMGIVEDPATGAAATALAGYFQHFAARADGSTSWTIRQGEFIDRPSTLHVTADITDGQISAIRVGGTAVKVSEGEMQIPD